MKISVLFSLLLFSFCGYGQDSMAHHYKVYDTKARKIVSTETIVAELVKADVLFFGEEHNDSAGHYLENKIFRELYTAYGNQLVLSMEMFETDGQLVLNEYLAGKIDESRFSKDVRLWSNYKDYRAMIEYAKQNSSYCSQPAKKIRNNG
jgi:uncharacterized iron-regulated protein